MKAFHKVLAAGLALAVVTAVSPSVSVPDTHQRVTPTQQGQGERQTAPQQAQTAVNETEEERYARTRRTRHRLLWDGKNRSAGDRAHKRMKRRRSAGRA